MDMRIVPMDHCMPNRSPNKKWPNTAVNKKLAQEFTMVAAVVDRWRIDLVYMPIMSTVHTKLAIRKTPLQTGAKFDD